MPEYLTLLFFAFFLAGFAATSYYFYKAWFDPEGYRRMVRKQYEHLPSWYPPKNYVLRFLEGQSWLWQIRIATAFGLAMFLVMTIVLLVAMANNIPIIIR